MITIVDRPDGLVRIDGWLAPAAALQVELRLPEPARPRIVTADAAGRFAFDGVPHGIAQLLVHPADGRHRRRGWSRQRSPSDVRAAPLADRAARLHAAALASSDNGRPASAVRQLRAGLRLIGTAADGGDPAVAEIRGRLLISLAWAESERGRVDTGFRLLDEAERHIPPAQRPILLAQRGLLLKRSGRNDLALRQYDEAVALLTEQSSPLDLVKVLNNRSLVHLEAGHIRLARADLRRCGQVAARHGLALHAALSRVNLGCMDVLAGDLPSALGAFAAARAEYERLAPGRLAGLAVERARALVAAGLFTEADHELADAAEQAAAQRLSHTYADARAGPRGSRAAGWPGGRRRAVGAARPGPVPGPRQCPPRRARRHCSSSAPTWRDAAAASRCAIAIAARGAGPGRAARQAGPAGRRAGGRPGRGPRADQGRPARPGPPGSRPGTGHPAGSTGWTPACCGGWPGPSWPRPAGGRPRPPGSCWPGWPRCTGTAPSSAALTCRPAPPCTGRTWPAPGSRRPSPAASPAAVYRWSERARAQALLLPAAAAPGRPGGRGGPGGTAAGQARAARAGAGRPAGRRPARPGRDAAAQRPRAVVDGTGAARHAAAPAPAPFSAVRDSLAGAALVTYLKDGPVLRALVVPGDSASLRTLGGVRRRRGGGAAAAGRPRQPRRAARCPAGSPRQSAPRPATMPPRSRPPCSARCWPRSATATWSWCRPAS